MAPPEGEPVMTSTRPVASSRYCRHDEETPLFEASSKNDDQQEECKNSLVKVVVLLIAFAAIISWLPRSRHQIRQEGSTPPPPVEDTGGCPPWSAQSRSHPTVGNPSHPRFGDRLDSNLVFCDNFDGNSLQDPWRPDNTLFGDGNGGFAFYNSENVAVEDGELRIRPGLFSDLGPMNGGYKAEDVMTGNCTPFPECATFTVENCTINDFSGCQRIGTPLVALNPVTSGRIKTQGRFDFTYGRIEARIRLPRGDWLWPAFWLMPSHDNYGGWPNSGEIDIMEARGNGPDFRVAGAKGGRDLYESCLHYAGNPWWHNKAPAFSSDVLGCGGDAEPCDFATDYFTVGVYWSDERMYSYVLRDDTEDEIILWDVDASAGFGPYDVPNGSELPPYPEKRYEHEWMPNGETYDSSNSRNAPFDKPFHIILNLAVGGEQNGCPDPGFWGDSAIWCKERDPARPEVGARTVFWNSRDKWLPTWRAAKAEGRDAFSIDWVKVWQ